MRRPMGSTMAGKSFLREAREIVRACPNIDAKAVLKEHIDELSMVYGLFGVMPSEENMRILVAAWTRVKLDIEGIAKLGGDNTPAGAMEIPKHQELSARAA